MLNQFDSQCWANLTLNVESIRLSMLSLFFSYYWVNLTQIFSTYTLCRVEFQFRQWLNFLCQNDLIFFSLRVKACRHNYSELDDATPQAINQAINQSRIWLCSVRNLLHMNLFKDYYIFSLSQVLECQKFVAYESLQRLLLFFTKSSFGVSEICCI